MASVDVLTKEGSKVNSIELNQDTISTILTYPGSWGFWGARGALCILPF